MKCQKPLVFSVFFSLLSLFALPAWATATDPEWMVIKNNSNHRIQIIANTQASGQSKIYGWPGHSFIYTYTFSATCLTDCQTYEKEGQSITTLEKGASAYYGVILDNPDEQGFMGHGGEIFAMQFRADLELQFTFSEIAESDPKELKARINLLQLSNQVYDVGAKEVNPIGSSCMYYIQNGLKKNCLTTNASRLGLSMETALPVVTVNTYSLSSSTAK